MPELPEVETARRHVEGWARGATIIDASSSDALVVPKPRAFGGAIIGKTIKALSRRGKYLRFELDGDTRIVSHFGMTGHWVKRAVGDPAERFERARIDVERRGKKTNLGEGRGPSSCSLRYVDARRLGRIVVSDDDIRGWKALGPDPLHDGVDAKRLGDALRKRKIAIKEALMDGRVVAGIGNILAAEALWVARIHPLVATRDLDDRTVRALAKAIAVSVERGIALQEKDDTYVNAGKVENRFHVYGHAGEPCPRCKTELTRIVQAGRSTVFCAKCQPKKARVSPSRPRKRIVRA